jgi:S-DNA-T family DNA segregation ATPase FtsK/SpoIIIE
VILSILSLYCAAGLVATRFPGSFPGFFSIPGGFFVGAFSWASIFIPLWFACAAILSFLPGWRPGAVAALALSIIPFLSLAIFARLTSEPETFLESNPILEAAGLPALGVGTLALAVFLSAAVSRLALRIARGDKRDTEASVGKNLDPEPPAQRRRIVAPQERDRSRGSVNLFAETKDDGKPFEFKVPDLPSPPRLQSLEDEPDRSVSASKKKNVDEADELLEELPPAEIHVGARPGRTARDPGASAQAASAERSDGAVRPSAGTVELEGARRVEFTSVPPAKSTKSDEAEAALERIRSRRKDKPYSVPSEGILTAYPDGQYWIVDEKTKRSAEILRETLAEFKIEAEVTGIRKGPVITMFEILPAPGVRLSKIANLADNIALRLAASSVRIVAPIPGKHAVGIEVPNDKRAIVSLREIVENELFKNAKMEIPIILGKDIAGEAQFIDLTQTPHLLIAGATGSGKSVCVNSIILSILYRRSPNEVRLILIDPKIVELKLYNDIPHLLTPVITEPKRAFQALQYCICEMERRYSLLDQLGVRDIKSYNRKIKDKGVAAERMPYIVVVVDEFADLMATTGKELESTLARLAAMSRAVGIHLVLATQRPSIDVITGLIKANIPSRIAFMVASKFDSRIIIDTVGAEKLLGRGDMLVATAWDPYPIRMQGSYVSEEEVEKAVAYVKTLGEPDYIDDEIFIDDEEDDEPSLFGDEDDDPLYEKALEIVLQQGKASASYIQRRLKIGYNRASRIVELMEAKGIVGPANGSKPRDLVRNPEVLGSSGQARHSADPRQKSLIPDLETRPNQRVTGRDDDEESGE